jgi:hypothetical protein
MMVSASFFLSALNVHRICVPFLQVNGNPCLKFLRKILFREYRNFVPGMGGWQRKGFSTLIQMVRQGCMYRSLQKGAGTDG